VTDWATAASLATAGGTLVLAIATFASIRSANKSARTAERAARIADRSLMAGQRPLLVASRIGDADQEIQFAEGNVLQVPGGGASLKIADSAIYLAASVRNVGTGLAVMHGWHILLERPNIHHLRSSSLRSGTFTLRLVTTASGRVRSAIPMPRSSRPSALRAKLATLWC
jgi:hypothetical protein